MVFFPSSMAKDRRNKVWVVFFSFFWTSILHRLCQYLRGSNRADCRVFSPLGCHLGNLLHEVNEKKQACFYSTASSLQYSTMKLNLHWLINNMIWSCRLFTVLFPFNRKQNVHFSYYYFPYLNMRVLIFFAASQSAIPSWRDKIDFLFKK